MPAKLNDFIQMYSSQLLCELGPEHVALEHQVRSVNISLACDKDIQTVGKVLGGNEANIQIVKKLRRRIKRHKYKKAQLPPCQQTGEQVQASGVGHHAAGDPSLGLQRNLVVGPKQTVAVFWLHAARGDQWQEPKDWLAGGAEVQEGQAGAITFTAADWIQLCRMLGLINKVLALAMRCFKGYPKGETVTVLTKPDVTGRVNHIIHKQENARGLSSALPLRKWNKIMGSFSNIRPGSRHVAVKVLWWFVELYITLTYRGTLAANEAHRYTALPLCTPNLLVGVRIKCNESHTMATTATAMGALTA